MDAFISYLKSLSKIDQAHHLFDCLQNGGDMAYELFEAVEGEDWSLNAASMERVLQYLSKEEVPNEYR